MPKTNLDHAISFSSHKQITFAVVFHLLLVPWDGQFSYLSYIATSWWQCKYNALGLQLPIASRQATMASFSVIIVSHPPTHPRLLVLALYATIRTSYRKSAWVTSWTSESLVLSSYFLLALQSRVTPFSTLHYCILLYFLFGVLPDLYIWT